MPAAVPLKGAVCATLYKSAVQGADVITYRSHDSVFRMLFLVAKAQINALCLYRVLLFKLHPFRKPHRGRGGSDTVEQISLGGCPQCKQPGQFACEECLDIIGPKGELKHVRILGPERSATQIELAQTDCRNIGIKAPVRSSGDTKGTPGVTLRGPNGTLTVPEGVMIADRHIHMTPAQAAAFGLADGDRVQVKIDGPKPGVMGGVLIRANDKCALDFHIDTDDGNAFLLKQGQLVTVLGKEE